MQPKMLFELLRAASVQAIVFDLDGVVLRRSSFARELEGRFGISPQMTRRFFTDAFQKCQCGKADLRAELGVYLAEWGWRDSADSFLRFWFECDSVVQTAVWSASQQLRHRGFTCCLASNQERHRAAFLQKRLALGKHFDHVFYSIDLGARKPDALFFRAIEGSLRLVPQQMVFLDDGEENVQSARSSGWRSALFTDSGSLEDAIVKACAFDQKV